MPALLSHGGMPVTNTRSWVILEMCLGLDLEVANRGSNPTFRIHGFRPACIGRIYLFAIGLGGKESYTASDDEFYYYYL